MFSISIDLSAPTFMDRVRASGSGLCSFFVSIDNQHFPSSGFTDFPIVVLQWWLENYLNLGSGEVIEDSFMNGPFYFTTLLQGHSIHMEFFQRTLVGDKPLLGPVEVPRQEYRIQLIQAAQMLIAFLRSNQLHGSDIRALENTLQLVVQAPEN